MGGDEAWIPVVLEGWRRGQHHSAVGPGPVARHLDHARRLVDLIDPTAGVGLDLGTGAGLPGLALAGWRPEMTWTLLDASARRIRLVDAVIEELGWSGRVTAVHARAEELARQPGWRASVDVVVARSFGPSAVTAECAAPFVRIGGSVLVTEPPERTDRWSAEGLRVLGLEAGASIADPPVQELRSVAAPEGRFPRQPGVARRRPLW